jgi:hypothetical protein
MKHGKKGIDVQLTWIFVLITGAVIFMFFMTVVSKQKELAEDKASLAVKNRMSSLFSLAGASSSAYNTFESGGAEVTFTCDQPEDASFRVGKRGASESLPGIVFSQSTLRGKDISTWSLDWLLPYRGETFLMVTNHRTKYIFYKAGDDTFIPWIVEDFPKDLDPTVITADGDSRLGSSGYDAYVIVQKQGSELADFRGFTRASENVYVLTISPAGANKNYGSIKFEKAHHNEENTGYYYRKEMLYGAIFAPEFSYYKCMMQRAFTRAKTVTNLQALRTASLHASASSGVLFTRNQNCRNLYGYIQYTFDNKTYPYCGNVGVMEDIVQVIKDNGDPMANARDPTSGIDCGHCLPGGCCSSACEEGNDFARLDSNHRRLVRETEDIALEGGCPYVY